MGALRPPVSNTTAAVTGVGVQRQTAKTQSRTGDQGAKVKLRLLLGSSQCNS